MHEESDGGGRRATRRRFLRMSFCLFVFFSPSTLKPAASVVHSHTELAPNADFVVSRNKNSSNCLRSKVNKCKNWASKFILNKLILIKI